MRETSLGEFAEASEWTVCRRNGRQPVVRRNDRRARIRRRDALHSDARRAYTGEVPPRRHPQRRAAALDPWKPNACRHPESWPTALARCAQVCGLRIWELALRAARSRCDAFDAAHGDRALERHRRVRRIGGVLPRPDDLEPDGAHALTARDTSDAARIDFPAIVCAALHGLAALNGRAMTPAATPAARRAVLPFVVAFALASLLHHAHNAEFLAHYPAMPSWLTRSGVYLAWLAQAAVGLTGLCLLRPGSLRIGLSLLAAYAALGFAGLDHYAVAPLRAHSATMNLSIGLEVLTALLLLLAVLRAYPVQARACHPDGA